MSSNAHHVLRASFFTAAILSSTFLAAPRASGAPDEKKAAPPKDDKAACLSTYESSQQQRKAGKLRAAKTDLAVCARDVCPHALRVDCLKWLDEVQAAIPTVVIEGIAGNGADTTAIRVSIDGAVVAEQLDGRAIEVDPGPHQFHYELGTKTKDERVVVLEGDRNRKIRVSFAADVGTPPPTATTTSSAPPPDGGSQASSTRPIPIVTWVFAGATIVGAGVFTAFALSGKSKESDLNSSCTPNCTTSQVDSLKKTFLIGDISLAVGVVSLGVATATFLTRKSVEEPAVSFDVAPLHGGAVLSLGGKL